MKKTRYEVEISRTNITPRQFFTYCRKEIERRTNGTASLSDWLDSFDEWEQPTTESSTDTKHPEFGADAFHEICRMKPFDYHLFVEKTYNFIMEFDFWDDKTGFGYLFLVEWDDEPETDPEQPETKTEPETTEEQNEPEQLETVDGIVYEIRENSEYNSREVYFTGKPAAETREALKALKMRWNGKKCCWYGFATESAIIAAIQGAELTANPETGAAVVTSGYMGGGAIYGAKSNRALYGKDLSAAIRADLKAAGVKGVTIACESYSGGQSIHATFTIERGDLTEAPTEDATRAHTCEFERLLYRWNYWQVGGECITLERFQRMAEAEQTAIALKYCAEQRERYANRQSLNHYHMTQEENPELSPAFLAKVNKVLAIMGAYHYDASNSMVDYFDTNFYYDLHTKPGKSWAA